MTKLIVVILVSVLVYANARHLHPHGDAHGNPIAEEVWLNQMEKAERNAPGKEEYIDVDVLEAPRNVMPSRFVPLNNALFFRGHQPCPEEGFKRDYMGVCREVWD